jgi:hypothetical protein
MNLGLLEGLFLLAVWGIVPLGVRHLPNSFALTVACRIWPLAALSATVSFFLPRGTGAAALALPWLAFNGLVALGGLLQLKNSIHGGLPSLFLLAAMMFPPIGGVHLVASRYGYALGGFPEPIILLTAIHFHYTAFAAPILAGLAARSGGLLARIGGVGVVAGTPLLAMGFLFSHHLKAAAVGVLCVSVIILALAQFAVPMPSGRAKALLVLSSLAVIAGMILAAVYEHGYYTGRTWISIPRMAQTHGLLNGLGFCLCGLLAYNPCNPKQPQGL